MFEELLAYLEERGVRFVVVGGIAVVVHGFARLTADIDLVIDLERSNVTRCVEALTERGLQPLLPVAPADFADEEIRKDWIEHRNLQVFTMRDPRNPMLTVDLFARPPIPFDELWNDATTLALAGRPIRIASLAHLITMKRTAGRPQDLIDVERLEAIARNRHA